MAAARPVIVQSTGDQLFACPTFALNEDSTIGGDEPFEKAKQALHDRTFAQQISKPVPFLHGLA
jgi:hypothetical protein